MNEKRCCIIGTAPTYKAVPWNDPTLEMWGLNDSWLLNFPRADRWYDIHPFGQFFYRDPAQPKIDAADVPAGTYIRPKGHLEWLAKQSIPVYIQAADPRVPRGIVFPKAEIEARFGPWFDSTPSWMLGHALLEGYTEIHVYGIHLATEAEYVKQKPNFCYLLGLARGLGATVIVAKDAPLLKSSHQYAFQPDPATPIIAAQRDVMRLKRERQRIAAAVPPAHWWRRADPVLSTQAAWLDAKILDAELSVQQLTLAKRLAAS
jgi:hypothetical protein